jgi:predicted O-linked N-acetylglucosamine transferase (SPINDLY family)
MEPSDLPPVRERAPFEDNGYVTFGCFNRLTKVSDANLATWARILAAIPDARLFMVVPDVSNSEVREAVERRLTDQGMPLDRMIFQERLSHGYHKLFHQVDIALDPYPYNGGTTSYDTLSMGVPLISLQGGHAAARTGVAVLTGIGLPELAAADEDDYVVIARDLACNRERLRTIREGLRERLLASPLMDHGRLATDVGDAFRAMWQHWLAGADI